MNIKLAKEEIKHTVEAYLYKDETGAYQLPQVVQRPILLIGPPGVGKTAIMEQVARECGINLVAYSITHHTRQSAIGLPFIEKREYGGKMYSITEYTMSEIVAAIYEKIKQTGVSEGILFLDEINCVSETMAPAMLQLLQAKTFGTHKIPEGWVLVAAGNPPEYNKSVRDFDIVTLDRVRRLNVEEDYAVWKEYAYQARVHGAIMSYLDIRPAHFYQIQTTPEGKEFVTARGWEDLSKLMVVYEKLGLPVDVTVIHPYLQHLKIAKDFAAYLELYKKYQEDYRVDDILAGNPTVRGIQKVKEAAFDERLSVLGLLIDKLNNRFEHFFILDEQTTAHHGILKQVRDGMARKKPVLFLTEILEQENEKLRKEKENGLLTKSKEKSALALTHLLEKDLQLLRSITSETPATAQEEFALLKENFQKEVAARKEALQVASESLEHAFDFVEEAFGKGQEMVMFLTELTVNGFSMRFVREHGCERYYRYNKDLLFEEKRRDLLKAIEEL